MVAHRISDLSHLPQLITGDLSRNWSIKGFPICKKPIAILINLMLHGEDWPGFEPCSFKALVAVS